MAKTTELSAVNSILTALGSIPVNTLNVATNSDASIAHDTLIDIKREVEQRGWWFNSFVDVAYAPSSGVITVPDNVLSLKPSSGGYTGIGEGKLVVEKDGQVYDVINNTNNFSSSVRLDIIVSTNFENLPEAARNYITVRTARIVQTKILGDAGIEVFTSDHEAQAFQTLEGEHAMNTPGGGMFLLRHKLRVGQLIQDPVRSTGQSRQRQ